MKQILVFLFGTSPLTTLIGYAGALAIEASLLLDAIPANQGNGWHIIALGLASLGRVAKQHNVTGGTVPATPEATKRVE